MMMTQSKGNIVLALIQKAHKYHGKFIEYKAASGNGMWLYLQFADYVWQAKFNSIVYDNAMCKCMQLYKKDSNITKVLI